ncbi:YaaR family protein [Paenibacillus protaetiae]|uniref:DUF327 family protein n=1 Tax=Paenibacillus protaetiae TaxID=2509456 RepID=A0A4P6F077_9BACL|nr:YaaR family protein [Paenibacillus protaetiae]QAY67479.1 DUF327 family protein [Paenibacillus protaetiae]
MKIDPNIRPVGQNRTTGDTAGRPVQMRSFSDTLIQQDAQRSQEELQQKLQDIHNQGERLSRSMTVRELKLYRHMVKQFLEYTARKGIGIKEMRGFDRRGRTKKYKLLDEIDETLVSMAEELLASEEGRLELLSKIGEIRGLLINYLY